MWALYNNIVVHIEANNLKLVQVSMIKVIGKLRHCFADLRTGTPFLVKPILGTARLTSLPRSPSFLFLRWPSSTQTATQILFFITNEKNSNEKQYWSRQAGRPQPVVKSEFRYVSVYEFLRDTIQQWKQIQNWNLLDFADVSDSWSSLGYYMAVAVLCSVITCRFMDLPTFQMNLLSPSWR